MSPSIDFSDVKGLDPVPEGTYNAEIVSAKAGTSSTGNPKIDLQWKIVGGEFDGRFIFDTLAFAPAALWRVKRTLQALDFPQDFNGDVEPEDLVGKAATLVVTIDQNNTQTDADGEPYPPRNRVNRVKPFSVVSSGKKSPKDLR